MAVKKTNASPPEQAAVEQTEQGEPRFSKTQLVRCARYRDRRDLVDALLDDSKKYTLEQVDKMIEKFMEGEVK